MHSRTRIAVERQVTAMGAEVFEVGLRAGGLGTAGLGDAFDRLGQAAGVAADQEDPVAAGGELLGRGETDSGTRTGDDNG